jgi:hypothetical protein
MKHNNLYSGLVMPSSGWWSPIIKDSYWKQYFNKIQIEHLYWNVFDSYFISLALRFLFYSQARLNQDF